MRNVEQKRIIICAQLFKAQLKWKIKSKISDNNADWHRCSSIHLCSSLGLVTTVYLASYRMS